MSNVYDAVEGLISAIKESPVYLEYQEQLSEVNKYPELKRQIDEYRTRNFEMQNSPDYSLDKLEQLDREYEELRNDPRADSFLASELAFCRMMQDVNSRITGDLQFD